MPPTYHHLSETTRLLCLDWLTRWPGERWAWRAADGEELTDEEWDQAQAMVDVAAKELIKEMLTGVIMPFAGSTIPDGFLECNGQELERDEYSDLFEVIGTAFGSDDMFTFKLPDLRTRVPVGENGETGYEMGNAGGEKVHELTVDEMPEHEHETFYHTSFVESSGYGLIISSNFVNRTIVYASNAPFNNTKKAGNGQDHNNMQPYLILKYIIKT